MNNHGVNLRSLRPSDKIQMARLANNKRIWDNVRDGFGHPYTENNAEEFIQRQAKSDTEEVFAIESNGELCGLVGLILQRDVYRKSAVIGYWVGEPFWGKGIATAAVGKIVRVAFEDLKLVRIYAGAFEYNTGSMRVLEKNGFLNEGIAKKAVFKNGKFWDEHRYALVTDAL
ncbi:GNAT family N-acetyltransferase [Flavobacteriaceae bacterium F89]|uniref:GNAT family N-acetyltransferase n=1 Tax=Cerina litoralis TaxID=2874477 RepID=A0AAE3EVD4_9FLAO|nr:GNAT family protein [Cerina litoralis]MCG2460342.1 GNAT family N-acetyltransferase [Cerina litoralis]